MLWTYATFFGILLPTTALVLKRRRTTAIRDIAIVTALAGYTATIVDSTLWRTQEGRMLESSPIVSRLVLFVIFRLKNTTLESLILLWQRKKLMSKNYYRSMMPTDKVFQTHDQ
jgi:hypothetical protein